MGETRRLGVDVGGTSVKAALIDDTNRVEESLSVATPRDPGRLAAAVHRAVAPWLSRGVRGTGVGVAGDVDATRGVVRYSPNLGWRNVPLRAVWSRFSFPRPFAFDNDANAAAWGAHHAELGGRSRGLIVLTLGTGVGGGLVLDGRLHRGVSGTAGEIGHLVVETDGDRCACGSRGCLESYLGARGMIRWARAEYRRRGRSSGDLDPKILADRARGGDAVARAVWRRAARALGSALTSLVNVLNPDTILLTGGVAAAAPLFLPAARRIMERRAFRTPVRAVRIRTSTRSRDLGVIGAALLVP